jgi:hypothetical protein
VCSSLVVLTSYVNRTSSTYQSPTFGPGLQKKSFSELDPAENRPCEWIVTGPGANSAIFSSCEVPRSPMHGNQLSGPISGFADVWNLSEMPPNRGHHH